MSKNIIVCLDGTWNDKNDEEAMSNVGLLHDMSADDGTKQVTYYDNGVGTQGWYDKKLGGVHGVGMSENIRQAYTFLVQNYQANDKVFIFGFSRGAYTARSLAGLLYKCGLLAASDNLSSKVEELYDAYKDKDKARMDAYKSANTKCPIEMLGVWDTVGALGIPVAFLKDTSSKLLGFHDTKLSPEVKLACHALALDEKRSSFEPTLWQETAETKDRIKQVWFAGVHSDIGGGYPERHHSDLALQWMVDHAQRCGLLIDANKPYNYQIDLKQDIHSSAFNILGREIGVTEREAPLTEATRPIVHWSVREKIKLTGHYKPLALKRIADITTLSPYEVEEKTR